MKRFVLITLLVLFPSTLLYAAGVGGWNRYEAYSKLFSFEAPGKMESSHEALRASRSYEAISEEYVTAVDRRNYNNSLKTYSIKSQQTWGPSFSRKEMATMYESDLEKKISELTESGIEILKAELDPSGYFSELIYSYEDPDLGKQAARMRYYYSDVTRVEMKISGPLSYINNQKSLRFFDSLSLYRSFKKDESNYETWVSLVSPQNIFALLTPPIETSYFPYQPTVESKGDMDQVSMVFYDPVRDQSLYYNIYGYNFDQDVNSAVAKHILATRHLSKYRKPTPDTQFMPTQLGTSSGLEYRAKMQRVFEKAPYLDTIILRARFQGKQMVVQEIMGSDMLTQAVLVKDLLGFLKFPLTTAPLPQAETTEVPEFIEGAD